ncbi:MAG TPA: alpha/beta fold hydrolase [Kiritimatiellia bacterium]|nr:alpha/beta fold hydrolase [Kiritimatiellia bacterium]
MKTKRRNSLLLLYLLLLLASGVTRIEQGAHARSGYNHQVMLLPMFKGEPIPYRRLELSYVDVVPVGPTNPPVVLLVHGFPTRSFGFRPLATVLGEEVRVIAPDLPGFGRSTRRAPDLSFEAQAWYLLELVERLGLDRVHVVGIRQGGGVALAFAEMAPDRLASLSLVSSLGVQEFELLGNHTLNRGIYGIQRALVWAVYNLIPHFGQFDRYLFNESYARAMVQGDLRPMRERLLGVDAPAFLVHGDGDALVHPGTSRESFRLMPQSERVLLEGGHRIARDEPERVGGLLLEFIEKVERGVAVSRAAADPARVEAAERAFRSEDVDPVGGVALIVLMAILAFSTLLSEDLACIAAGLLVAEGVLGYFPAATAAFIGIFGGDILLFMLGWKYGRAALRQRPFCWIFKEDAIQESAKWFSRKGPAVVLLSRFIPGSRLPTFFSAGMLHASFWWFMLFFMIAGLVWAPFLVWVSSRVGQTLLETFAAYKMYTLVAIVMAALILWLMIKIVFPLFSFRGRRLLLSRWRRWTRWEFWPLWLFYPPILLHILYLGVRYRGLNVFMAANPGIPLGGLIGESKKQILDGFKGRRELIARCDVIPSGEDAGQKEARVLEFMDEIGASFPVVLKPDAGQRGQGVAVIRSVQELATYLGRARPDLLVQEYVPGYEFGVFYYRIPGQARGHIFSITEKRFPVVVGDGKHDLERLILKDDRAVCLAPVFLRRHRERLDQVLAEGETFTLVELGTHCRGSVFQDGIWIKTDELEKAIDDLAQSFDGFYFGRFDLRTPDLEDFKKGVNFKVIEVNGVTSEATHIYNPGTSLGHAYGVLMKQWRLAFRIGQRNRRNGAEVPGVGEAIRAALDFRGGPD